MVKKIQITTKPAEQQQSNQIPSIRSRSTVYIQFFRREKEILLCMFYIIFSNEGQLRNGFTSLKLNGFDLIFQSQYKEQLQCLAFYLHVQSVYGRVSLLVFEGSVCFEGAYFAKRCGKRKHLSLSILVLLCPTQQFQSHFSLAVHIRPYMSCLVYKICLAVKFYSL